MFGKTGVSYEGPPPIDMVIRSLVTFDKFLDKLYYVSRYEK